MVDLIENVKESFAKAEALESKLPPEVYTHGLHKDGFLQGMSTPKVRHFLNNLCAFEGVRYLEIGTYLGSTLISAAKNNTGVFAAIDSFNWNHGKAESTDITTRQALDENLTRFQMKDKVVFVDADCWTMDKSVLPAPFNVYFYDGAHQRDDQKKAVTEFVSLMKDEFILVVDDWQENRNKVPAGTYDGISASNLQVIYETEAPNGDYHMGLGIFVLRKRQ